MRDAHENPEAVSAAPRLKVAHPSRSGRLKRIGARLGLLNALRPSGATTRRKPDDARPASASRPTAKAVSTAYPAPDRPYLSYRNLATRSHLLEGDVPVHECMLLAGSVCVACGLSQLTLMSARDPGASPLTFAIAMIGLAAATCVGLLSWNRSLHKARPATTSKLAKDAMTEGEKALLKSLRRKPIRISYRPDGWRPTGSLPAPATTADLNALIMDRFAKVDHAAGSIVVDN